MDTILFFISSTRHTCGNRLEGIYRYARERDWHVQVVERAFHAAVAGNMALLPGVISRKKQFIPSLIDALKQERG